MKEQYWMGSWWLVSLYVCYMLATSPGSFLSGVFLAQRGGTCNAPPRGAITSVNVFLIMCFLQFLNFQRNNKTIIYRLLDVANQIDWVSAHREATPPH